MSYKEHLSGGSKRSGNLPVYHVVPSQDDDFIEKDSYVDGSGDCETIPLAAVAFQRENVDLELNLLTDVHNRRFDGQRQRHGVDKDAYDQENYSKFGGTESDVRRKESEVRLREGKESEASLLGGKDYDVRLRERKGPDVRLRGGIFVESLQSSSATPRRSTSPYHETQDRFESPVSSEYYSTTGAPFVDDIYTVSAPTLPFSSKSPQISLTDKPVSTSRTESTTTAHLNIPSPASPQQNSAQTTTDPEPALGTHPNIFDRLHFPVNQHSKDITKVGLIDRENILARTGGQNNITSDVSDRNNSLQGSAKNAELYPRSNDALTSSKNTRTDLLNDLPADTEKASCSNTPYALQASHGNGKGDNYILKQGDNSRLVASLDVPETTKRKFAFFDNSSSSIDPDNPFQNQSMGDHVTVGKNGHKLEVLAETGHNGSDAQPNGVATDHRSLKKKVNGSAVACNNKVSNGVIMEDVEKDDDSSGPCGWGKFQFNFCQRFRDAKWFLVVLTMCGACQGMAVNGFVNTVISTVERRYEISSTESGLIASCYDIMFVILVIPISYFGGQGHKPRYLGIGIFVLGIGSFVFALPHFISGYYHVENADETVCVLNHNSTTSCSSTDGSTSLSNYKYFFYLGQLLHGAGATPLYTLGVTFMDENVPQRSSSFYNGIFYTGAIIGPAIGYMVGAKFLDFYTDVSIDPASLGLDPNNPKWVGAWWIGFLISGVIGVLLSLPLLAFPAALPGSSKFALERGTETQASKHVDQTGQHRGLKDILLSLKYLLTNIPFMFINIAAAADGILVAGFSTFMPKFIEYEFGLPAGTAALYVGLAVVPAGGGATFGGGFIVKCFNLKMRGILRLCTVMSFILCALAVSLLMECDTTPFAGVTLSYGQTNVGAAAFLGKNLEDSCNKDCACSEEDYFPVCGRDKVLYFSPCYAGCTHVINDGITKKYTNCSCINYNLTTSDYSSGNNYMAEFGKCEFNCKWLTLFLLLFGVMIVFVFITSMPSLTATLRCVPDHQRSFGLGIQWIVARCLGSIPGPILFGKMFDFACLVWQKRCSGDGSCFFYDTHKLSLYLLALALAFAIAAAVSFLTALCFYKATQAEDEIILQTSKLSPQSPLKAAVHHNNHSCDEPETTQISLTDSAHKDFEYNGTNL